MSVSIFGLPYTPFAQPVSVLAPRSVNVPSQFMSRRKQKSPKLDDATPFAQRRIKQAPAFTQAGVSQALRRNVLDSVRLKRDDALFERRADDMMRSSFLQQQRDREALLEQEALQYTQPLVDEEEMDEEQDQLHMRALEADKTSREAPPQSGPEIIEEREMQELETLLELLPTDTMSDLMDVEPEEYSDHYGSDGEDLDSIMQQILEKYDSRDLEGDMDLS